MKVVLTFILIFSSLLLASNAESDSEKKSRAERQIKIEMEKEKKYAKEQTFYSGEDYDLKGAEVNQDSIDSTPEIEVDDFNIDSVYD